MRAGSLIAVATAADTDRLVLPCFSQGLMAQEPTAGRASAPRDGTTVGPDKLKIAKAVACRSIDGYERYQPLPGGAITAEEKLQVYYRVSTASSR